MTVKKRAAAAENIDVRILVVDDDRKPYEFVELHDVLTTLMRLRATA